MLLEKTLFYYNKDVIAFSTKKNDSWDNRLFQNKYSFCMTTEPLSTSHNKVTLPFGRVNGTKL
jgi:hypothetical protein